MSRLKKFLLISFILIVLLVLFSGWILTAAGQVLIREDTPVQSEVVVVLNSGMEIYPRLIEAARLYRDGYADKVIINGGRKHESIKTLERKGFQPEFRWYDEHLEILQYLGVPRSDIITITAEDVYDTNTEAATVGQKLLDMGLSKIIITTSKFHTRRAGYIWEKMYADRLEIIMVQASQDDFSPSGWWKQGRHVRNVMFEYGAWVFYLWKYGLGEADAGTE
jgi:uncharacterized SAM-binding protein YcdF (DUF218 family)